MRTVHYVKVGSRYKFYLNGRVIGSGVGDSVESAAKAANVRHAYFVRVTPDPYMGYPALTESLANKRRRESQASGFWEWRYNARTGWYQVKVDHPLVELVPVSQSQGDTWRETPDGGEWVRVRKSGTVQGTPELCTRDYEQQAGVPHAVRATTARAFVRWWSPNGNEKL